MQRMTLTNQRRSIDVDSADWQEALTLASRFGWEPRGTESPTCPVEFPALADATEQLEERSAKQEHEPEWCGCYCCRAGQIVTGPDARSLSASLRRAIAHVPKDPPPYGFAGEGFPEALPDDYRLTEDFLDYFAAHERGIDVLRQLVEIASEGPFTIS